MCFFFLQIWQVKPCQMSQNSKWMTIYCDVYQHTLFFISYKWKACYLFLLFRRFKVVDNFLLQVLILYQNYFKKWNPFKCKTAITILTMCVIFRQQCEQTLFIKNNRKKIVNLRLSDRRLTKNYIDELHALKF